MVRLRVAELMRQRGWTAYRFSKESGFAVSMAYRLARTDGRFGRLDADVLDRLCSVFHVQPGELLEQVQEKRRPR